MAVREQFLYVAIMGIFTMLAILTDALYPFAPIIRAALFLVAVGGWIGALVVTAAFPEGLGIDEEIRKRV